MQRAKEASFLLEETLMLQKVIIACHAEVGGQTTVVLSHHYGVAAWGDV